SSAVVNVPFVEQPVIGVLDQFGNLRSSTNGTSDNTTTNLAKVSTGSGTLSGTTTKTASDGVITFTDLANNTAGTFTIVFTNSAIPTNVVSGTITNSTGPVSALAFAQQPTGTNAGSVIAPTVTVRATDASARYVPGATIT